MTRSILAPPPHSVISSENPNGSTVFTIDENGSEDPGTGLFKDLNSALDALPDQAGDVTFLAKGKLHYNYSSLVLDLPLDKGITSFTLASADENVAEIARYIGAGDAPSLFANGIPVTIGKNVTFNGFVYGGSNRLALEKDASVIIDEGAKVVSAFGGSYNADLTGDTNVVVRGTVTRTLAGSGHANPSADASDVVADVHGSTSLVIEPSGRADTVLGGGRAEAFSSGNTPTNAQANVSGSATLHIAGATGQTHGGGWAGPTSYASSVENAQATANLGGSTSIVFEASAISSSSSMNKVYGGGWAQSTKSETNSVVADVGGSTYVEALGDDTASSNQPNKKAFNALYGGGWALYRNAQANVEGDTLVKTARPSWESREGIAGGGYASWGATANVGGTTSVEVFGIEGQLADYENANLVVGGGIALCGVDGPTTNARCAATSIVVHTGARLTSGSSAGANIIGGGYAISGNTNVDVAESTNVVVEDGVSLQKEVVGGGAAFPASNAGGFAQEGTASARTGATSVMLGKGCTVGQNVVGGGRVMNAPRSNVDAASTSVIIGAGSSINGATVGGGFVFGSGAQESSARVAGDATTVVGNDATVNGRLYVGDGSSFSSTYAVGGGLIAWSAQSCNVDVGGTASTKIGDGAKRNSSVGGGLLFQAVDGSANSGAVLTSIGAHCTTPNSQQWTVAAGRVISSTGSARVGADGGEQDDAVMFEAGDGFATYLFVGGGIAADAKASGDTDAGVTGNVRTTLASGTVDWFYSGAYLGDSNLDKADIDGNISTSLSGTNISTTFSTSGLGSVSGDVRTTLKDASLGTSINAEAGGKVAGNQTFSFVGSMSSASNYLYADHSNGTALVEIGDEQGTETTFDVQGIWAPNASADLPVNVVVHREARLNLLNGSADNPYHLTGLNSIVVEEGGTLNVSAATAQAKLYGNLSGAGTVSLPAGGSIVGDGTLDGSLTLLVNEDGAFAAIGQTYFDFSDQSTGTVTPANLDDSLKLADASEAGRKTWTIAENTHTVAFDSHEGTDIEKQTIVHGGLAVEPDPAPTRDGYAFDGWFKDAEGTQAWDFAADKVMGDMTLHAKWNDCIKVNVELSKDGQGEAHGTVDPETPQVFTGEPLRYTLTPAYGYRIDSVTVDGSPLSVVMQADMRTGAISYEPESTSTIVVTFVPLDSQKADEIIDNLPTVAPDDSPDEVAKKTNTVLDAKLDYESMPEDEKEAVKQEVVDKLNDAVASLPNVDVKVEVTISTELASNIDIPEEQKSRFIGAVSKDEIEQIKSGAAEVLKIVVEIKDIDKPADADEQAALEGELGSHEVGQHFSANVTKQLYENATDSDPKDIAPITTLPAPVQLTFDVPTPLINMVDGTTRSFAMVRTHFGSTWEATFLADEDGNETDEKVTVTTDRFSTYSIVYKDAHRTTFDANGGSAVDSQTIDSGGKIAKPADPTREGYDFAGWYKDSGFADAWDFATDTVTGPVTLYAKWTEEPPTPVNHTVTFVAKGGQPEPTAQTVVKGGRAEEPSPAPEKTGYAFGGWFRDEAGTQPWDFAVEAVESNTMLYAAWTPETYTVTFEANGGSVTPSQTVPYRGTVTEPTEPTRDGYDFAGWWKDAAFTATWNFSDEKATGPVTLYAKWTESVPPTPGKHTVVFDARGGSPVPDKQTIGDGTSAVEPTEKPQRTGYAFDGWFSNKECTTAWNFSSPVTDALTLYAKWTALVYDVTFETNGGTPIPSVQKTPFGQHVQPVPAPSKEGFAFVAWYSDAQLETAWDFTYDVVEGPLTLYAKWVEDAPVAPVVHTVSFDTRGGTDVAAQIVEHGATIQKPADPVREGYGFAGWFVDETLSAAWSFDAPVTTDMTLYAMWTKAGQPGTDPTVKPLPNPGNDVPPAGTATTDGPKSLAPTGDSSLFMLQLVSGCAVLGAAALAAIALCRMRKRG